MSRLPVIHLFCLLLLSVTTVAGQTLLSEGPRNWWPGPVTWVDALGEVESREIVPPLFFYRERPGETVRGMRPLFYERVQHDADRSFQTWLFPLFHRTQHGPDQDWHYLLIGRTEIRRAGGRRVNNTAVFPFFYYQSTGVPEELRGGLFPVAGRVRGQFFHNEADWIMFPLYARLRSGSVDTYYTPFPFIRTRRGPDTHGFEVWPLFGARTTTDLKEHRYVLWPLGFSQKEYSPKDGTLVRHARGFLPVYSHQDTPTLRDRNYLWPFFGITESLDPVYTENRYFWPFLVRRTGEDRDRVRVAPFYTHRKSPGMEQQWVLFPFFRTRITPEYNGLVQRQSQFLYFLLWDVEQTDPLRPEATPARKLHLWPFFSAWDSGAGQRQSQLFSPLEVFFPESRVVRELYTPLFALYRHAEDESQRLRRRQFLFQLITYERRKERVSFDVGPLFSFRKEPEGRGFGFLRGLYERSPQGQHRLFWFPFRAAEE